LRRKRSYDNMLKKRLVIIEVLAAVIGLSLPGKPGSDEVLLQILQRPKGKRLITRALKGIQYSSLSLSLSPAPDNSSLVLLLLPCTQPFRPTAKR